MVIIVIIVMLIIFMNVFQRNRTKDFRAAIIKYLEALMENQQQVSPFTLLYIKLLITLRAVLT